MSAGLLPVLPVLAALPITTMLAIFDLELLLGQRRVTATPPPRPENLRFVVLMPAHNEAAEIGPIVQSVIANLPAGGSLLVVADNCTDETATIAREKGAEVIEREDPDRRGKGYALDFGREHLRAAPPDVVLILDADCYASRDAIEGLVAAAHGWGRPVQAAYLLSPDRCAPLITQISSFAFLVKNRVRQRALYRYGGGVVLTGTGMAFPWHMLASAPLASPNIVEDLALGVWLTASGNSPAFLDEVEVLSKAASTDHDTLQQRRRWEHGFVATATRHALPMLWRGATGAKRSLFALGLHLLVPPLTLLLLLAFFQLALLVFVGDQVWLTTINFALLAMTGLLTTLSWWREGREYLSWSAIARVPVYILAKIPSYAALMTGRKTGWVRTKRSNE